MTTVQVTPTEAVVCPVCGRDDWGRTYERLGWEFVECEGCGLLRLEPLPSEADLVRHYAERAEAGNYELARSRERDAGFVQVFDFAARAGARGGALFDVGCFDGRMLDLAVARGWEGWGLELQEEAAGVARSRHGDRIFQGSLEAFEPPAGVEFDLVTAIGLLEHLRDPTSLFSVAFDLLRPGGLLVIQTPNRESIPARVLGRYWPPIAPPEHTFYFGRSTLERVCARHGLTPVALRPHFKRIRLGYAYDQFQYFGPEVHRLLGPVVRRLPPRALAVRLPLYGGEMLFAARR